MPTADQIIARYKELFPNAVRLSKNRLDGLTAKLLSKLPQDADEAAIDALLQQVNDFSLHTFEELVKEDDRIRNLEAKHKKQTTGSDIATSQSTDTTTTTTAPEEAPAWFKPIADRLASLEQQQQGLTQTQKLEAFRQAAKAKNIPASFIKNIAITADFDPDATLATVEQDWKEFQVEVFNNSSTYQPDNPQGSASKKEASKEKVDAILKNILPTV